jgi:hypothetical protein
MKEFIAKHIFERIPFYEKSNFVIESNRDDDKLVIEKIIEILKQ